ncbi:MAG TPA: calcium/sodium antiporter [Micavibrio sp.]|nr:calcium/sodium antiporter [Micavibrio sp.]
MSDLMSLTELEALILALGALGLGMIMLIRGGNWTIDAAVYIARKFGVSPLVVGFTVVAFGTSLPELIVSINANLSGLPGIAIGNVLGSNVANILLVLGATALVAPIVANIVELRRDLIVMILATLFLAGAMLHGMITPMIGFGMIAFLAMLTLWQYKQALKGDMEVEEVENPEFKNFGSSLFFLITGLCCIALGAEFLVRGAKVSAEIIGVPDAVIGLSVIAIGTSLPELSTCIIAAMRKQTGIILGNIIGSNVFNILMIIGVAAMVKSINMQDTAASLVELDIWVTLGVSVLFTLILFVYGKIGKKLGVAFLAGYFAYMIAIFMLNMA